MTGLGSRARESVFDSRVFIFRAGTIHRVKPWTARYGQQFPFVIDKNPKLMATSRDKRLLLALDQGISNRSNVVQFNGNARNDFHVLEYPSDVDLSIEDFPIRNDDFIYRNGVAHVRIDFLNYACLHFPKEF